MGDNFENKKTIINRRFRKYSSAKHSVANKNRETTFVCKWTNSGNKMLTDDKLGDARSRDPERVHQHKQLGDSLKMS